MLRPDLPQGAFFRRLAVWVGLHREGGGILSAVCHYLDVHTAVSGCVPYYYSL